MQKKSIDVTLAFLVLGLMIFGMIMISSVSVYSSFKLTSTQVALGKADETSNAYYLFQNMSHVFIGIIMLIIFSKTPYTLWEKYAKWIFLAALGSLVLVFVPGVGAEYNGAKGWLDLPGFPSIQPVEFAKITLIIMLAAFIKKKHTVLSDFHRGFIPYFMIVGVVLLLLMFQPDFGSVLIIAPVVVLLYFIGGGDQKLIFTTLIIAMIGALGIYGIGKTDIGKTLKIGYISERIDNFLRSNQEITESNNNDKKDYQLKQGFIALGSGGFFGLGFGKSIQKFGYLPEVQGDFIFSVIVEELGFVGAFFLIAVYLAIVYRGLYIARSVKDLFGRYLAFGITLWIFIQASINMGVNLNLVPLTGVTLPFVSYGGTSMIALTISIGILLSISRHSEYKPQNLSDALQAKRRVIF